MSATAGDHGSAVPRPSESCLREGNGEERQLHPKMHLREAAKGRRNPCCCSQRGPHLGSSPDAIPSCKVIDHRADSRCVVRSLPNPEP
jgi:hypothetical protein